MCTHACICALPYGVLPCFVVCVGYVSIKLNVYCWLLLPEPRVLRHHRLCGCNWHFHRSRFVCINVCVMYMLHKVMYRCRGKTLHLWFMNSGQCWETKVQTLSRVALVHILYTNGDFPRETCSQLLEPLCLVWAKGGAGVERAGGRMETSPTRPLARSP